MAQLQKKHQTRRQTKKSKEEKEKETEAALTSSPTAVLALTNTNDRFIFFPKLPPELRRKIWKLSMSVPRAIELYRCWVRNKNPENLVYPIGYKSLRNAMMSSYRFYHRTPTLLQVCTEARTIGKKEIYTEVLPGTTLYPIYFNLECDILYMDVMCPTTALEELEGNLGNKWSGLEEKKEGYRKQFLEKLKCVYLNRQLDRKDLKFLERLPMLERVVVAERGFWRVDRKAVTMKKFLKDERAVHAKNPVKKIGVLDYGEELVDEALLDKISLVAVEDMMEEVNIK